MLKVGGAGSTYSMLREEVANDESAMRQAIGRIHIHSTARYTGEVAQNTGGLGRMPPGYLLVRYRPETGETG